MQQDDFKCDSITLKNGTIFYFAGLEDVDQIAAMALRHHKEIYSESMTKSNIQEALFEIKNYLKTKYVLVERCEDNPKVLKSLMFLDKVGAWWNPQTTMALHIQWIYIRPEHRSLQSFINCINAAKALQKDLGLRLNISFNTAMTDKNFSLLLERLGFKVFVQEYVYEGDS